MYPETPGYQAHSDTSREAADRLTTAQKNQRHALDFIKEQGARGATIDEVCVFLSGLLGREVPPNAISGRFIELENRGLICKTPQRRKTRSRRNAVVYIAGSSWSALLPEPRPGPPPPVEKSAMERFTETQQIFGHGHVVARKDAAKERCGGPAYCKVCKQAQSYKNYLEQPKGEDE